MNHRQRHVYLLIIALLVVGVSTLLYRHNVLSVPFKDKEMVNSWTVEASLRFHAERNKPIKANFFIPYMPLGFAILDEYFVSQNYGITTNLVGDNRQTVWSIRRAKGDQTLYYRAIFRETNEYRSLLAKPGPVKVEEVSATLNTAADTFIKDIRQTSADVQTFAQTTINLLNRKEDNAKLLVNGAFNDENVVKAAIFLLGRANIPAQAVHGIQISKQNASPDFKLYLAVFNGKEWIYISPRNGHAGLPHRFLIWQYGTAATFSVEGGNKGQFNISVSPTPMSALALAKERGERVQSQLMKFSLLQLPVNAQQTYKVLLMIPLGAFVILLLRNFVGLRTFGTFMPVLIALAFRETHVAYGIFLFLAIVSCGLLLRFYLDSLHLLLVPRLSAILTIVIMLMLFISILMQNLGIDNGLSVALFPMVILTMTIERMCITWDERGPSEAILNGAGSLLAAVIAYYAMNIPQVQYLFFAFPEMLLILLAMILLFGQYRGYRLFELFRFKAMAEPENA